MVTIPVDAAAATIVMADNTSGTNGITISSGIRLNVSGAITMTAPTAGTSTINVGAGTLNAASITIAGSATAGRNCAVTVSTGTITTTGSVAFTGTAAQAQFTSTGASTVNVGGNFESGGTLTTTGTGAINFTGSSPQTLGTYTTYNNVTVSNASGGVALTGTTTIGGTLTVTSGTFTVGPYTLTVSGATSVSGRLSITSTTGTKTFTGDVTINSGGVWDNSSGNEAIDMAGSLRNDGTFGAGTGVHTLSGTTKTISGVSTISIPNLTINGTVTNNGTLNVGTALSGSGTLTNGTGATLGIGGTSGITTLTATANPNTVDYNGAAQTVRAITYHHLSLSGSGAKTLSSVATTNGNLTLSGTCTAATAVATTISGNLSVGTGTTFTAAGFTLTVTGTTSVGGTLAHSSATGTKTYNGLVTIDSGGSWTNAGNSAITFQGGLTHNGAVFSSGTGVYTFATNSQAVEGVSALSIGNVTVTGVTLTNNAASFTVTTALSGTGDLVQGSGATLNVGGTSGVTTLDATADPNTVAYNGAAQTVKPTAYHDLTLSGSGAKTLTNTGTIYGDLTLLGTCTAVTAITTTIGGDLSVGAGTTLTVAGFGLTVTGATSVSGTLAHSSAAGTKTHVGLVSIESGGSWTSAGNSAITFQGGLTHNGTTFSSGTGVYTFNTSPQTVEGMSAISINNVTVNGIRLTNNSSNFTVATALSGTGELLQETGATLYIGGTSGIATLTATAIPNTVNYSGAAQTVKAAGYHHLTLSGSGAKTLPSEVMAVNGDFTVLGTVSAIAAAAIHTAGSFTIGSSASFDAGSYAHDLKGAFSNNNSFAASNGTMAFSGAGDQSIGGSATTTFNNVTVDKVNGVVQINTDISVDGMLDFAAGNINTGANAVVITATGSVSRTSGHVVGNLRKHLSAAAPSQTFEIGDASSYCPLSVTFSGISSSGDLTGTVTAGDHPNIGSSSIDSVQSVNKYWTLTNSGIVFTDYDAGFSFTTGDIDGGAKTDSLKIGRYAGSAWTYPTIGTRTATRTEATDLTEFGDFGLGEDRPDPPVLAAIGPQTVAEGDTLTVEVSATDPDDGGLTLTVENLPTNAVFVDDGDGAGRLTFNPSYIQAGSHNVTFFVSDGLLIDSEIVAIAVTAVDAPPVLDPIGSQTASEGDTLEVEVSAIDPDGSSVTLAAENLPTNAAFVDVGDGTGSLTFSPDFTQAGSYSITIVAFDGVLADSEVITIEITAVDRVPVLAAIGSQSIAEGDTLAIDVSATDPDGDSLILSVDDIPENANFIDDGDGTGRLMFTPNFAQAGVYNLTFVASNGALADSEVVVVTVTGVNQAPVLAAIGSQTVFEGDTLTVAVSATDSDMDSLILSAENLPANAVFSDNGDGTGNLNFSPNFAQAGEYNITFIVSDGVLADSEVVVFTVVRHDAVTISGNVGLAGATLSYLNDTTETATADGSGFYSFSVPYNWSGTVTPGMGGYTFAPTDRTYANVVSHQIDQDFTPSIVASVDDDVDELLPDRFALAQNYPNPFNPTTTIEYSLPNRSRVTVEIFNLLGQTVRTLVDEDKAAGNYRFGWDGTDTNGRTVSSGTYLYRIIAGDFAQCKKMVLLK